jgi:hypothetical protein
MSGQCHYPRHTHGRKAVAGDYKHVIEIRYKGCMEMTDRRSCSGNKLPRFGMLSIISPASQAFCLGRVPFPAR